MKEERYGDFGCFLKFLKTKIHFEKVYGWSAFKEWAEVKGISLYQKKKIFVEMHKEWFKKSNLLG